MKLFLVAIYDSASGVYDAPNQVRSEREAARRFIDMCENSDTPFAKHPEDFTVFRIGIYDDNTGLIEPCAPEKIINGVEALAESGKVTDIKEAENYGGSE